MCCCKTESPVQMTDIVTPEKRSLMMSGIQGKNTKPEMIIRKLLHNGGYRFRIHVDKLPGKPDIVLKKYQAVIFVHGCFWHGHNCKLFKWPQTRPEFWTEKIRRNKKNDEAAYDQLKLLKWRICVIWECSFKGAKKANLPEIAQQIGDWLRCSDDYMEIGG
jgi:DNA mismatch endonuclease (patch repair protein)